MRRGLYTKAVLLCIVVVSTASACGSGAEPSGASPAPSASSPTVSAAVTESSVPKIDFPVRVDASHKYLVDAGSRPVLLHGEAAWSLIVQLEPTDVERYLADREQRGVNALVVNLVEHKFADHAPNTIDGIAPFTDPENFATPNDAYFHWARDVIERARSHGMIVMLAPAYAGYKGGDEGWFDALNHTDVSVCRQYAHYVANTFAGLDNIVWVHGGDYAPPAGSKGEACALAILETLRTELPGSLHLGHWGPNSASLDLPQFAKSFDLNAVYYYGEPADACLFQRNAHRDVPTLLFETKYEGEYGLSPDAFRRQAWGAVLSCSAGQITGNRPIWLFDDGWRDALDSPGSRSAQVLQAVVRESPWTELIPVGSDVLITSGRGRLGKEDFVVAAVTADRRFALLYVPTRKTLTIDGSYFPLPVAATWVDPTTGSTGEVVALPNGTSSLSTPSVNAAGDHDWVLRIEAR